MHASCVDFLLNAYSFFVTLVWTITGPTASNFETNQCYAMAQEVLFGDPFEFSVVAEETLAQRLNALNPGASDDVADAAQVDLFV